MNKRSDLYHGGLDNEYVTEYTNYPRQTLRYPRDTLPGNKAYHPTQKPVALLEYLIRTYTLDGDIVLDNCMGSGSTCVAAVNTGRRYIGFEMDERYFGIARERIAEAESVHEKLL